MKTATMKIYQGRTLLMTAKIERSKSYREFPSDDTDKFLEDLFNIERYINAQGAYRCHMAYTAARDAESWKLDRASGDGCDYRRSRSAAREAEVKG